MFKAIGGVLDWFVVVGLVIIFVVPVFVLTFPFSLAVLAAVIAIRAWRKRKRVRMEPIASGKVTYIHEIYRF